MRIKVFADGASLEDMIAAHRAGTVQGFTTNPTLMRKAGVGDYEAFADDFPSTAAGVSDRLWEMENIVKLIDNAEPAPRKRGPYRPRNSK